jgi:hypothetical protein
LGQPPQGLTHLREIQIPSQEPAEMVSEPLEQ